MAPYEHVVVVMSIVLGLAITQLLKGAAQLYRGRTRVRTYWLHWAWVVLLVFFSLVFWWSFWSYRDITEWDFFRFVIYLSPTIALFLLIAIAFPDPADPVADMKEYYFSNRAGFFGTFALFGALTGLTAMVVRGQPVLDLSNLFRLALVVLSLIVMRSASERLHTVVWSLFASLLVVFIVLFQFRLA